MQNDNARRDHIPSHSSHTEIDYTPKKYNLTESLVIMLKFFSVPVIIFLFLWFFESH